MLSAFSEKVSKFFLPGVINRLINLTVYVVAADQGFHLTECIYQFVLESQLPHKIVNLLFTITNQYIKSMDFRGS